MQVLLRWALQHGCLVIPKSTKPKHLRLYTEQALLGLEPPPQPPPVAATAPAAPAAKKARRGTGRRASASPDPDASSGAWHLSAEQMALLDAMEDGTKYRWDPKDIV